MASDLDLPFGPWTKIVSAQWGDTPLSVYKNAQNVLLSVVFDKAGDEVNGLLVLAKKAFYVEGDLTKFILAQKRDMTFVEKFSKDGRHAFLLVQAQPKYVAYDQKDLADAVEKQLAELDALGPLTKEVAQGYGATATDLADAGEDKAEILIGDPLFLFSLSNAPSAQAGAGAFAKAFLGMDAGGARVEPKLAALSVVTVAGASRDVRLHAMHVLLEEAVQANVPCVVFDSSNALAGFDQPTGTPDALADAGLQPLKTGFPQKTHALGKGLFIDLASVDSDAFLSAFSLQNTDAGGVIKRAYDAKRKALNSIDDVVAVLGALEESKENPQYLVLKAIRVLRTIQKVFPSYFAKSNVMELQAPWREAAGRVVRVDVSAAPKELARLCAYAVLNAMTPPPTRGLSVLLAFEPDAATFTDEEKTLLVKARNSGMGLLLNARDPIDLDFVGEPSLRIETVGSEIVASEKGEKLRRARLRPALTACAELQATAPAAPPAPTPAPNRPAFGKKLF